MCQLHIRLTCISVLDSNFPAAAFFLKFFLHVCAAPITCSKSETKGEEQQMTYVPFFATAIGIAAPHTKVITSTRTRHRSLNQPHEEGRKQTE
jgi:hypothetical protein